MCHMLSLLIWKIHPCSNIAFPTIQSLPSTAATLLAICLIAVMQASGYSVFYNGDTPILLGLPW